MELGFTRHARRKMHELGMTVSDVTAIVAADDVIEEYEDRAGVLLHGIVRGAEVHVSVVRQAEPAITLVTTVYEVDGEHFPNGRTRRSRP